MAMPSSAASLPIVLLILTAGSLSAQPPVDSPPVEARIRAAAVRFLLEIAARDEHAVQIGRIGDDRRDGKPFVAVGLHVIVVVFLQRGVLAVWRAVLAQVTRQQIRCRDFE